MLGVALGVALGVTLGAAVVPAQAARSVFSNPTMQAASRAEAVERERGEAPQAEPASAASAAPVDAPAVAPVPTEAPSVPEPAASVMAAPASAPAASTPASAVVPALPPGASTHLPSHLEPRAFGLTLGDVLTLHIALPPDAVPLQPEVAVQLAPGRIGPWLERQGTRPWTDPAGRRWLLVDHQVINVPARMMTASLPPLALMREGAAPLAVAGAEFSLGPLTAPPQAGQAAGMAAMPTTATPLQPDHLPPPPDVARALQRLQVALGAWATVVLAWVAFVAWRHRHDARTLPFAQALRQVQAARRAPGDDTPAWVAVHHALNTAAGRSLHASDLEQLFQRWPLLAEGRDDIQTFFAASSARFFRQDDAPASFDLLAFACRLRAIEQRTPAPPRAKA